MLVWKKRGRLYLLPPDEQRKKNPVRQESARINAFHKMSADPPTLPVTGLLRCGLRRKVTHYLHLANNFSCRNFLSK